MFVDNFLFEKKVQATAACYASQREALYSARQFFKFIKLLIAWRNKALEKTLF
jgi:hypothetical protein